MFQFVTFNLLIFNFISIHPYFVSLTEIKHNKVNQSLEISCRLFTDNFEDALKKTYHKNIDILHTTNKQQLDSLMNDYVQHHLLLNVDGKSISLTFIGYEKEEDAIWCYLEVKKVKPFKKMSIENILLYDFFPSQTNMIHVIVNENRQSTKLNNPDKKAEFFF